jgi:hypothetical protein
MYFLKEIHCERKSSVIALVNCGLSGCDAIRSVYPENGGNVFLLDGGNHLQDYTASQPWGPQSTFLPPWKPQISYVVALIYSFILWRCMEFWGHLPRMKCDRMIRMMTWWICRGLFHGTIPVFAYKDWRNLLWNLVSDGTDLGWYLNRGPSECNSHELPMCYLLL